MTNTDDLIHAKEMVVHLDEQMDLILRAQRVGGHKGALSYIRNLGICPHCLERVASAYSGNDDELIEKMPSRVAMTIGFCRGTTLGLILGRENPR